MFVFNLLHKALSVPDLVGEWPTRGLSIPVSYLATPSVTGSCWILWVLVGCPFCQQWVTHRTWRPSPVGYILLYVLSPNLPSAMLETWQKLVFQTSTFCS